MDEYTVNILIAEDNPADIKILQRAFQRANLPYPLFFVRDGEETIDLLLRRGRYTDPSLSPCPALILLDIKMPKLSGIEVLRFIKNEPSLRRIPVTMLTSSAQLEDVTKCYEFGANSYIVKSLDFDSFVKAIQAFCDYWALLARLPGAVIFRRG